MRCRRARKLTFEFIDGRINDAKRLELENHLAGCSECEKHASQLTRSMDLVHRAPVEMPGDNFAWKVRLKLNQERKTIQKHTLSEGSLIRSWNVRYAAGALAACAVVVVAGLLAIQSGLTVFGPNERINGPSGPMASLDDRPSDDPTPAERSGITSDQSGKSTLSTRVGVKPPATFPNLRNPRAGRLVSGGNTFDRTNRGFQVIDQSPVPVLLDLDSIINMEIEKIPPEERARYIQARLRSLQNQLQKYGNQNPDN